MEGDILSELNVQQKTQIYFARTYRHLKPDNKERWFYLLGCILPCLVLLLSFYTKISYALAVWVKRAFTAFIPESSLGIAFGEFLPFFGGVYYVEIPIVMPSIQEAAINIAVTLVLLYICFHHVRISKGGTPISIFFCMILLTHLIASIFFMFAKDFFPYSATDFSGLYIKQQVSIWLSLLVLTGLFTGVLGYGSVVGRLITFFGIMVYSFVFGCVRYLAFMYIISTESILYMATLFFTLGPLFDFLYLVSFYGLYINSQIKRFNQGEGRLNWHWL